MPTASPSIERNTTALTTLMTFIDTDSGQIAVSILLGLGLAALFRKACKDNSCIIIKSPSQEELDKYYKIDDECYKYTKVPTECRHDRKFIIM